MQIKHLLSIKDLSVDEIKEILKDANNFLNKKKISNNILKKIKGKSIINLFFEDSTRTLTSFELAGKKLGASVINMSIATSAIKKGESLIDTAMTLNAMNPDILIVRHNMSGVPYLLSEKVNCSVINAGDGSNEHPTQALLDALTIMRHKKRITNLEVAIMGDVLHSRVARSNIYLLNKLKANVRVISPPTLLPAGIEKMDVKIYKNILEGLENVDIIMVLRIQKERMQGSFVPSEKEFFRFWGLDREKLNRAKKNALVMHPGPINRGIEIDSDVADDIGRSLILEQVKLGVAVRMSVINNLFFSTMIKTIFKNAHIIDPVQKINRVGNIIVDNQKISEISFDKKKIKSNKNHRVIDCKRFILCPGFVDMKCHLRVPGEEHKENLSYASEAASSSGITSLICMPNTNPIIDNVSIVELLQRKARKESHVKIYSTASITKKLKGKELTEFGLLHEAGALAFTDAITSVDSSSVMYKALKYASAFDLLLMQHPQEKELSLGGAMTSGKLSTELGVKGIPIEAEVIQVERDIRLAEMTNGKLHFLNISTGLALDAIQIAQKKGIRVTCSTSPNYFTLDERDIKKWRTFAKLSPPLRDKKNLDLLKKGIADNIISCITSDHAPHDTDSKRLPYEIASSGSIGFQSFLPLTLNIIKEKKLGLTKLVELLSSNPAKLLKLKAGNLKKGYDADIVIFDPNKKIKLTSKIIKSKSKNFPYDNTTAYGEVLLTMVDGKIIFNNGKLFS